MAKTASELLIETYPALRKDRDRLMYWLANPDTIYLARFGCSVREFLEKNGVDITNDPVRTEKMLTSVQTLPPGFQ